MPSMCPCESCDCLLKSPWLAPHSQHTIVHTVSTNKTYRVDTLSSNNVQLSLIHPVAQSKITFDIENDNVPQLVGESLKLLGFGQFIAISVINSQQKKYYFKQL
jgi:hypothetical protein